MKVRRPWIVLSAVVVLFLFGLTVQRVDSHEHSTHCHQLWSERLEPVEAFSAMKNNYDAGQNRIEWAENCALQWSDFAGQPDYRNWRVAALTSSIIQYRYVCEGDSLSFEAKAIFVRNESWVKNEGRTDEVLDHERLHFDITEHHRRQLEQRIAQRRWGCQETAALERAVNRELKAWRDRQREYDHDTWFSIRQSKQREWGERLRQWLAVPVGS